MAQKRRSFAETWRYILFPKESKGTTILDRFALSALGATDIWVARMDNPKEKQLIDTIMELSKTMGVAHPPKLLIYDSIAPNAASILNGHLAVSTNLLDITTDGEKKAVVGHELAHHRHHTRDTVATVGGITGGWVGYNATVAPKIPNKRLPKFLGKTALVMGEALLYLAYRRALEFESDREAAHATGRPQDMASALQSLQSRVDQLRGGYPSIINPGNNPPDPLTEVTPSWGEKVGRKMAVLLSDHPPTIERISRLKQMENKIPSAQTAASPTL